MSIQKGKLSDSILYQLKTFVFAFRGILAFFRRESKAIIHLLATILAVAFGLFFRITAVEWLFIVIAIGMVFIAEFFNTITEVVSDLIQPEYDQRVADIKDMAAGAVLIAAIVALIIGLVIFLPRVIALI
jgi:diacylglycerol kinase (ATP)